MRLSEKTIEVTLCARMTEHLFPGAVWFGLTQQQEAQAGFDVAAQLGKRLLVLQFKASERVLKSGARQFKLPHDQFTKLAARTSPLKRWIYYVFPLFSSTGDLTFSTYLLDRTRVLDVAAIPALAAPTTRGGTPRKDGCHYVDVLDPFATFHSVPTQVKVETPQTALGGRRKEVVGALPESLLDVGIGGRQLWGMHELLTRKSALVVLP